MSRRPRLVHRKDGNEPVIVDALLAVGASVESIGGKGIPDLLVGYDGKTFLLEVKQRGKTLNGDQEKFHRDWKGQVSVVRTVGDALEAIGCEVKA